MDKILQQPVENELTDQCYTIILATNEALPICEIHNEKGDKEQQEED